MTHQESSEPGSFERQDLTNELRERAEARLAAGGRSFDELTVDIGAEDRAIQSAELLALREVVARQVDLLKPSPARSLLGRVRAKIESMVVRPDGPVPVLIRREVNELSIALLQYVAALSRDLASLRSQVSRLSDQLDEEQASRPATGGSPEQSQPPVD